MIKSFSRIGLGCVTFGREIDKSASFALMDYALAHGITLFDTASAYGSGASETIVGAWLSARRSLSHPVIIATKILPPYEPKHISECVDQSLENMGIDAIDLLYLHCWDPSFETPDALEAFNNLIRNGKVRMLGASNFNAEQLGKALIRQMDQGFECFRSVQNNHNLAVRDVDVTLKRVCGEHDISIVTYSPLGAGFLTGKYQKGIQDGTRFSVVPDHQKVYFNKTSLYQLKRLQMISKRTGHPTTHLALAWALHQPGVNSVLIGCRSTLHLDQAFAALAFYDPDIFTELESVK